MITVAPAEDRSYDHTMYEPFWAAAQDLDMPISLHVATNRPPPYVGRREQSHVAGVAPRQCGLLGARVARHLILAGVFERYPRLRVGSAEHELGVGAVLPRPAGLHVHAARPARPTGTAIAARRCPATSSGSNAFLSFQEDAMGIRDRALIGVDTLMWGSDYPHTESTFPRSRAILERILDGVPASDGRSPRQRRAPLPVRRRGGELRVVGKRKDFAQQGP